MKKLLLSLFSVASFSAAHAQCNELFISEYVEGTGNDKALEIYNPTNAPINLTGYRIERFSNGSSTSSAGGVLNLSGTIAAHDAFVIVNGQTTTSGSSPACSPVLQAMADQLDGIYPAPTYMNGNDAIVLFNNSTIIDIFGKTGDAAMVSSSGWSDMPPYDGSSGSGAIWTENHTLIRKSSVMQGVTTNPTPEFIVTMQWDSLSVNTWDSLGAHTCACPVAGVNEIDNSVSTIVYPNPSTTGNFSISAALDILSVEVYDSMGRLIRAMEEKNLGSQLTIDMTGEAKGLYILKARFDKNRATTIKLAID
jgi:hypothetical protein